MKSIENVELHAIVVKVDGVNLPYTIPARPERGKPAESGVVFISMDMLEELQETAPAIQTMIGFNPKQQHALEAAGWANRQTRGGMAATEEFRKSTIVFDLYTVIESRESLSSKR